MPELVRVTFQSEVSTGIYDEPSLVKGQTFAFSSST